MINLDAIKIAQQIAKDTLWETNDIIQVGMSEKDIYDIVSEKLLKKGSDAWWYHGIPCLVLLGRHSAVSVGSEYKPTDDYRVGENDVITIDTAPTFKTGWGDYARTFFMENGRMSAYDNPSESKFKKGLDEEKYIHNFLLDHCSPDMTFETVFTILNDEINRMGFKNLDFKSNLGHTIEINQEDRLYLEKGNDRVIGEIGKPFTLEPHISYSDDYGFKREDIYIITDHGFERV